MPDVLEQRIIVDGVVEYERSFKDMTHSMDAFALASKSVHGALVGVAAVSGAAGVGASVFVGILRTGIQAQNEYMISTQRLALALRSQVAAQEAINDVVAIAAKSPFTTQEVVGAMVSLAPVAEMSGRSLKEMSNLALDAAAAVGKSGDELNIFVNNIQRAALGSKEASSYLSETTGGLLTLIPEAMALRGETAASAVVKSLEQFRGMSETLAATPQGAFSTLSDSFQIFAREVAGSQVTKDLVATALTVANFVNESDDLKISAKALAETLSGSLRQGLIGVLPLFKDIARGGLIAGDLFAGIADKASIFMSMFGFSATTNAERLATATQRDADAAKMRAEANARNAAIRVAADVELVIAHERLALLKEEAQVRAEVARIVGAGNVELGVAQREELTAIQKQIQDQKMILDNDRRSIAELESSGMTKDRAKSMRDLRIQERAELSKRGLAIAGAEIEFDMRPGGLGKALEQARKATMETMKRENYGLTMGGGVNLLGRQAMESNLNTVREEYTRRQQVVKDFSERRRKIEQDAGIHGVTTSKAILAAKEKQIKDQIEMNKLTLIETQIKAKRDVKDTTAAEMHVKFLQESAQFAGQFLDRQSEASDHARKALERNAALRDQLAENLSIVEDHIRVSGISVQLERQREQLVSAILNTHREDYKIINDALERQKQILNVMKAEIDAAGRVSSARERVITSRFGIGRAAADLTQNPALRRTAILAEVSGEQQMARMRDLQLRREAEQTQRELALERRKPRTPERQINIQQMLATLEEKRLGRISNQNEALAKQLQLLSELRHNLTAEEFGFGIQRAKEAISELDIIGAGGRVSTASVAPRLNELIGMSLNRMAREQNINQYININGTNLSAQDLANALRRAMSGNRYAPGA